MPLAVAAACAAAVIVSSLMPAAAPRTEFGAGRGAGAYFSGVHSKRKLQKLLPLKLVSLDSKELFVGLLFAAGCALPALSRAASGPLSPLWSPWSTTLFFAAPNLHFASAVCGTCGCGELDCPGNPAKSISIRSDFEPPEFGCTDPLFHALAVGREIPGTFLSIGSRSRRRSRARTEIRRHIFLLVAPSVLRGVPT